MIPEEIFLLFFLYLSILLSFQGNFKTSNRLLFLNPVYKIENINSLPSVYSYDLFDSSIILLQQLHPHHPSSQQIIATINRTYISKELKHSTAKLLTNHYQFAFLHVNNNKGRLKNELWTKVYIWILLRIINHCFISLRIEYYYDICFGASVMYLEMKTEETATLLVLTWCVSF